MTFYTYTLETVDLPAGHVTVKLYSTISGLTIPSYVSLFIGEDLVESADVLEPGSIEIEQMVFHYSEDYSRYPEGFWYKILTGGTNEIQILLNDGRGDTHYFWGRVEPVMGDIEEIDLTPYKFNRSGTFKAVSALKRLEDVNLDDLYTEVQLHLTTLDLYDVPSLFWEVHSFELTQAPPWEVDAIKVKDIIASMIKLAYGQSFDTTDAEFPYNSSGNPTSPLLFGAYYQPDSGTTISETPARKFEDLWIPILTANPNSALNQVSLFGQGTFNGDNWVSRFANVYELLRAITKNFCYMPRYYYDVTNSRHKIQLVDRGYSFTDNVTFETPKKSTLLVKTETFVENFQATRQQFAQAVPNPSHSVVRGKSIYDKVPQPDEPDINIQLEFNPTQGEGTGDLVLFWQEPYTNSSLIGERLYANATLGGNAGLHRIGRGSYWTVNDFIGYIEPSDPGGSDREGWMAEIVARHLLFRLGFSMGGYERTYCTLKGTIGASSSTVNVHAMIRTQINDGVTTRTFFAARVSKNLFKNEMKIRWQQLLTTV